MAVAFSEGMLKCVSTDTIREVARAYDDSDIIQRPSYGGEDDAVKSWLESVGGLDKSVRSVVDHTINRRKSMVLEGVSIAPSNVYIDQFKAGGGVGLGVLLKVTDEARHREHLVRRGFEKQLKNFDRIRAIQNRMIELAEIHGWMQIDQAEIKDNVKEITAKLRTLYS
jgi:2-phosphoglycerate kinase